LDGSWTDESWTDVQRKSDENPTDVRRKLDGRPTKVGRKSNGRPTKVGRVELNRCCGDGGRQCLLATLQRWPRVLQLAALLRRWPTTHCNLQRSCGTGRCNVAAMASNMLDLAALLRWPAARWTSRCVVAMSGSALGLGALL
jgi:hypothetical protein